MLLVKIVRAESALVDLWLTMHEDRNAYVHLDVDDVIQDIHKIREKLQIAIGRELCTEKVNIVEEELCSQ